jgi:hypothetical protein
MDAGMSDLRASAEVEGHLTSISLMPRGHLPKHRGANRCVAGCLDITTAESDYSNVTATWLFLFTCREKTSGLA